MSDWINVILKVGHYRGLRCQYGKIMLKTSWYSKIMPTHMPILVQFVCRATPSVRYLSIERKNWGKSERLDISLPFSFYHILYFVGGCSILPTCKSPSTATFPTDCSRVLHNTCYFSRRPSTRKFEKFLSVLPNLRKKAAALAEFDVVILFLLLITGAIHVRKQLK